MDSSLKQRLVGAAVLAALAVIFLPMLLQGPDVKEPDAASVELDMPAAPEGQFETRELPLTEPAAGAPEGGVLGMPAADPDPDAIAPETVVDAGPVAPPPELAPPAPAKPVTPDGDKAAGEPNLAAQAGGNFVVSVGSFANLENANALAARLRAQKLPVVADRLSVDGKSTMRLRVGPYADRALAEIARVRSEAVVGGALKVVALDAAPAPAAKPAPAAGPAGALRPTPAAAGPATGAPAPSTGPASKPGAAPSPTGFAVQLAAPANEKEALALRDRARAAGFVSFVQRVETQDGARFRVRLGPEQDRGAAEKLRDGAAQKLGVTGIIVRHP